MRKEQKANIFIKPYKDGALVTESRQPQSAKWWQRMALHNFPDEILSKDYESLKEEIIELAQQGGLPIVGSQRILNDGLCKLKLWMPPLLSSVESPTVFS